MARREVVMEDSIADSSQGGLLAVLTESGRPVGGFADGTVRTWEPGAWQQVEAFPAHSDSILALAASPDERRLVTTSEGGERRLWDLVTTFEGRAWTPKRIGSAVTQGHNE